MDNIDQVGVVFLGFPLHCGSVWSAHVARESTTKATGNGGDTVLDALGGLRLAGASTQVQALKVHQIT